MPDVTLALSLAAGPLQPYARVTADGSRPDLTFESIPACGATLLVVLHGRATAASINSAVHLVLGDTAPQPSEYAHQSIAGLHVAPLAEDAIGTLAYILAGYVPAAQGTPNLFSAVTLLVTGYAGATSKPVLALSSGVVDLIPNGAIVGLTGGNWQSAAPVSRLSLVLASGNWAPGSYADVWIV
jgi:hypothetical protein